MKSAKKYLADPGMIARKLHWSWLRRTRRSSRVTVDAWNGRLTFNVTDRLIGKLLFVRRSFERDYLVRACEFLDRHGLRTAERDVMVDVGANIGMIAVAAVKHGYFREAIAVEPAPENFELLSLNIAQNGCDHLIHARRLALSSRAGSVTLVIDAENSGADNIGSAGVDGNESMSRVEVEATTFDELMRSDFRGLIGRVGLVWMDIEGHEAQCLAGAGLLDEQSIPVVSEFFPRLIEERGPGRDEYLAVLLSRFERFAVLDDSHPAPRPVDRLADLYHACRHARDAINLILFRPPRSRSPREIAEPSARRS